MQITIAERKNPSEKGATHYAFENTYEAPKKETTESEFKTSDDTDVPF